MRSTGRARRGLRLRLLLCPLLVCGASLAARADDAPAAERLLVGTLIGSREAGTLEVLRRGDDFEVPLDDFARLAGIDLQPEGDDIRLTTPLGVVTLGPDALLQRDGQAYLDSRTIEQRLATAVRFDEAEFALQFDLPWSGVAAEERPPAEPVVAQLQAPDASLSTLHGDASWLRMGDSESAHALLRVDGRLGPGYWKLGYEDDFEGDHRLRDYAWYGRFDDVLLLAGRQAPRLHPVLSGFEMTGVQAAWTNQPRELFPWGDQERELLPRRLLPVETFRGEAPPGTLARLRIDGSIVAEQVVGLDGRYEFADVRLPARQLSRIEIAIYERHLPSSPIQVDEVTVSGAEHLLGRGAVVHQAGIGVEGNQAQDWIGPQASGGFAGFYQWRQGVSRDVTLEGGLQEIDGRTQMMGGLVSRLAPGFAMSLAGAWSEGRPGYGFDLDGRRPGFRLRAASQWSDAGFSGSGASARYDHVVEAWLTRGRRVEAGIVGRSRSVDGVKHEFVLPALVLRPHRSFYLRAQPGLDGSYSGYAALRAGDRDRLVLAHEGTTTLDWFHSLSMRYRLAAGTEYDDSGPERFSLAVSRLAGWQRRLGFTVGVFRRGDETGGLASASVELLPGVLGRLDYQSAPYTDAPTVGSGQRLQLGISVDLAMAGGRVLPARGAWVRPERGAVAGRVVVEDEELARGTDLAGLTVSVDGTPRSRTRAGGTYFLPDLQPGVHLVELDVENLPIELAIRQAAFTVEVAAGATTRADFAVAPEYGLAGRVRRAGGKPARGVLVLLLDPEGRTAGTARSDRYGLFRIDGLPPGSYLLRPADSPLPGRVVEIRDGFLFDQDLWLPEGPGEPSETEQARQ